jgi:hypothetical protein
MRQPAPGPGRELPSLWSNPFTSAGRSTTVCSSDGWENQMSNDWEPLTARRSLTVAVIVFAAAFGLHGIDHLRRGMAAFPPSIMVGGMIQGIFVVVAVVLILRHHRWASLGSDRRRSRQRGGVCLCAFAAYFSPELSRQLHFRTTDQRHMVLLAHGRRRGRDWPGARLRGPASTATLNCEPIRPGPPVNPLTE